jgi:uncharacterized protein
MRKAIAIITLLLFLVACNQQGSLSISTDDGDHKVAVEMAATEHDQEMGLMHRDSIGPEEGMLFVFEKTGYRKFWMKNTKFPLDIIYINSEGKITEIIEANPCVEDPCTIYESTQPARWVLEVNQGYTRSRSISSGDEVLGLPGLI